MKKRRLSIDRETLKRDTEVILKEKDSFLSDFKKFIMKGNVLDLAVAVVIANAFNAIVNSLVNDIITPVAAFLTSGVSIDEWEWVIQPEVLDETGAVVQSKISVGYGFWLQSVLNFLIIAFCIFVAVRILKKLERKLKAKEIAAKEDEESRKKAETDEEEAKRRADAERQERTRQQFYENVQKMTDMMAEMQKSTEKVT